MTLKRFFEGLLIHTPYVRVKIHNLIRSKKLRIFLSNPKKIVHFDL
jgi:hypothetical protein